MEHAPATRDDWTGGCPRRRRRIAQTDDVTGTWALKSEARKSEGWNIGALSGTLTLALNGREITGTWKGPVRPEPWTLAGS